MRSFFQYFGARPRFIVLIAWLFASSLVVWHQRIVDRYLVIAGDLGNRPEGRAVTPLNMAYPAFAADAQTWVRHALSLLEGNDLRLRFTQIDNAPAGREVHWNSAWAWSIALAGKLEHWVTGQPLPQAVERATLWLPSVVLIVFSLGLALWSTRRGGAATGVFVAFALPGSSRIFEGFFPGYVDHHGLLSVAVVGLSLGAFFMGAGWVRSQSDGQDVLPGDLSEAKRAATASALWGAFGMWVSAASSIPPIAIIGAAGFLALIVVGRTVQNGKTAGFQPDIWRRWGNVGAITSFGFYLLEYAPSHIGLRLESNHPLYSLAWWGAGNLIAEVGGLWLGRTWPSKVSLRKLVLPLCAVLAPAVVFVVAKERVFVVMDPFLANLHNTYIQEFMPIWKTLKSGGWELAFHLLVLDNAPLLCAMLLAVLCRRRVQVWLWFGVVAVLLFSALAAIQARWLLNAAGCQTALAAFLVFLWTRGRVAWKQIAVASAAIAILYGYSFYSRISGGLDDLRVRRVSPRDAQSALNRDIAAALRATQPSGDIVMLSSPNSSTAIGYYGRFKTLGTLYWENNEGLKAAAQILSARSEDEAAKLIKAHGVTHLAILSEENFISQYFELLNPSAKPDELKQSFGHRLFADKVFPVWLRMIPYKVPDDLAVLKISVLLLQVAFDQTPADALYHIAMGKVALGQLPEAEQDFDTLIERSPESFQPYFRKAEILYSRGDWTRSAEFSVAGINRSPVEQRRGLLIEAAARFYRQKLPVISVQLYRLYLKAAFDPEIAAYLAYILASSSDETVRDTKSAAQLVSQAAAVQPTSLSVLGAQAVVAADLGDFPGAVAFQERVVAFCRQQADPAALAVAERRLAEFKAGRAWRE
jgi:tetratricopeptide (TPR) repeat protein